MKQYTENSALAIVRKAEYRPRGEEEKIFLAGLRETTMLIYKKKDMIFLLKDILGLKRLGAVDYLRNYCNYQIGWRAKRGVK